MKKIILIIFLLAIPFAFAQNLTYTQSLTLENKVFSSYSIVPQKPNYTLEYVQINFSFFPKETDSQHVFELNTFPNAKISNDSILFNITNPNSISEYEVTSKVRVEKNFPKIKGKVEFPIRDAIPDDVKQYTEPSDYVESGNPEIIRTASQIASGEDDLFAVAAKLADWTKQNIKYDLSSLAEGTSQKAGEVLQSKKGKCDDLTNLFLAMARSLGIPARFVSGVSYTELIKNNWGPHGWAEIYFPGYGWIPFDATYGEFGFTDPTHVLYKITKDTKDITTGYGWYGKGVKVEFNDVNFNVSVLEKQDSANDYSIELRVLHSAVDFGSYNLIIAKVSNPNDYYIAPDIALEKVSQIQNLDGNEKTVILPPKSSKTVFWTIQIKPNLDPAYEYSFPVIVSGSDGTTAVSGFTSSAIESNVTLEDIERVSSAIGESEIKEYTKNFSILCSPDKEEYMINSQVTVNCSFKNNGNIFLSDLEVCMKSECKYFNLGISQEKSYWFNAIAENAGKQTLSIFAKSPDISATSFVDINVDDIPKLTISEIRVPENISYNENATVLISIGKNLFSKPRNVEIKISSKTASRNYQTGLLAENKSYEFQLKGSELLEGRNEFAVEVSYEDITGKNYSEQGSFSINLMNIPIGQRILLFFKQLLNFMR